MMDNKNIQNAPNISNVVEVIKSSTNVVNVVLKNIVTASSAVEKIDIKKFQANTKKFNKISSTIYTYLDILDSVINTISKTSADKTGLDEMLQYYERIEVSQNPEGKEIKNIKTGYKIIDATSQLGVLFKNVVDSINTLGGIGGKENMLSFYLKTKVASEMIKSTLEDMLTAIVNAISSINTDKLSKAQQLLVGDPEVIEQANNILRNDSKNKDGATKSSFKDLTKTTTTKARQGLLEGISTIFAIIDSVTNFSLNPLKFVLFKIKLKIIRAHLIEILGMMNKLVPGPQRKSIKSGLDFLIGDGTTPGVLGSTEDPSKGFMGLVASLSVIADMIKKTALIFGIKKIHQLTLSGLSNIMEYIEMVLLIVDDKSTKNLLAATSTQNNKSVISQLSQIFEQLNGLSDSLLQIAFKGIILSAMKKYIIKTVDILLNIVEKISEIFVKFNSQIDLKTIIDQIKDLKDVFIYLNILALAIIGFTIIAGPAIIAAFLSIGFIWVLMWCLKGIIFVLELFPNKVIRNISRDILKLAIIFYSLIAVELALIAVAAITMEYWELMLYGLIGVTVLLGLSIGALWLISLATKKGIDIKTMLALLLLTAILGALTIVMLLLVGVSFIVQYIEWSALGKALLLFAGVLVVLVVIGIILSVASGVLAPLAGVVGTTVAIVVGILIGMLSIFAIILGAQKMILEIQNIKLDKKVLLQKIEDLFDIVFEVTGSILDKRLGRAFDGTFIKLRRAKRLLNKINKVFDKLVGISRSLTELSKITIPNNVTDKIQFLFNVIFGEDDESFAIVPTISKMEELVEKRKATRKAKRLLRQVCGVTKQLANVAKSLNDIANFNIEESAIQSGLTKIFDTVNFVQQQVDEKLIKVDENATERAKRRALRQDKKKMRQAAKALGKADEVLLEIEGIVDSFNKIKDFKLEKSTIETAISGIFANIDSFIQTVDKNTIGGGTDMGSKDFKGKLDALDRISSIIKGFIPEKDEVDRHKNFTENNIKFLDKINNTDLAKLGTTAMLFEKMADFSASINGNFEGLADTLNEKIAPLLEELKELMDGVGKKVEKSGADTSASIFAAKSGSKLTSDEMKQQIDRQMPKASESEKKKELQKMTKKQNMKESDDETIVGLLRQIINIMGGTAA